MIQSSVKLLLVTFLTISSAMVFAQEQPPQKSAEKFAVVELFTSEGCSSCPPAEANLARIKKEAEAQGVAVYPIAWHVDYWDYIGWKDPFASKQWSDRQRSYAQVWRNERIYTPQMVVNGKVEFVGSRVADSSKAISDALKESHSTSLDIGFVKHAPRQIILNYSIKGDYQGKSLYVVLVESGLVSNVNAGENRGRTLHQENVARGIYYVEQARKTPAGTMSIPVPENPESRDLSVIAFLQDDRSVVIDAADALDLGDYLDLKEDQAKTESNETGEANR